LALAPGKGPKWPKPGAPQNPPALAFHPLCGKLGRVKNLWAGPLVHSRYPLAVLAGLLLAASFPKIGIPGLAWIAPALMLAAAFGKRGGESFRIGYVAGLPHYLASLYWLLLIPYRWHSIPLGPAAGWLALSAFLALYPATWVWLLSPVRSAKSEVQGQATPVQSPESRVQGPLATDYGLRTTDYGLLAGTWPQRTVWAFSGAALWVALEMLVARLFGGFPWNLLGASQYQMLPLIQIASLTGIYGVSFLVVWTSLSLLSAASMVLRRPTLRWAWISEIILPFATLMAVFNFGLKQLAPGPTPERTLKVTFVQPSIPQTLIWDTAKSDERFHELLQLSELALTNQTDLLLWPEAAVPKLLRWYEDMFQPVTNLAQSHHLWMILGADDMEQRPGSTRPEDRDYFNSSFLISPEGTLMDTYRKRGLVIFGEYTPLEHWLPFMKYFTPIEGGFTPGQRAEPFELTNLKVKTSVLICFEDIFPHLARDAVFDDTDFLVNLTNNGWFGESAAQWQHAASALFRAVENGLPLLRCSNNGLTCWVDPQGRRRQIFHDQHGSVYGAGFMTAEIPLLPPGEKRPPTFYHEHGDWFGWSCAAIAVIKLAFRFLRRRGS
jgi:apolipoprotein N-acyltransferase